MESHTGSCLGHRWPITCIMQHRHWCFTCLSQINALVHWGTLWSDITLILPSVEWKVQQSFFVALCWKQACYFISLLETWVQLSSLITPNKLKGDHCWYGYCCDNLTSKRRTQIQFHFLSEITTPSTFLMLKWNSKAECWWLNRDRSCNVDGAAVEGASLQLR